MDPSVTVAIVTVLGSIIVALIGLMASQQRRTNRRVAEVHEQVTNSHSSNLRDDLDQLGLKVNRLTDIVVDLSTDLRLERRERVELAARFREMEEEEAISHV